MKRERDRDLDREGTEGDSRPGAAGDVLVIGNLQTGKTLLFHRLCRGIVRDLDLHASSTRLARGQIRAPWHHKLPVVSDVTAQVRGEHVARTDSPPHLVDTPGTATLFPQNEEEQVVTEALLTLRPEGLLLVADCKNLRRSLALFFHAAFFDLPMVVALNMSDEARQAGVRVDLERLVGELGVPVVSTSAIDNVGTHEVARKLLLATRPSPPPLPVGLADAMTRLEGELAGLGSIRRGVAMMLLGGEPLAGALVLRELGPSVYERAQAIVAEASSRVGGELDVVLTDLFYEEADEVARKVLQVKPAPPGLLARVGAWAQHPVYGVGIAALVLTALYLFVGELGATLVVDWLNGEVFQGLLMPACERLLGWLPWPVVYDALMDPDFGLLPTGLFLALGIVLPVLLFFYLAFAILQDSGYLARLSVLLDRLFRTVGLNGRGVVPLAMGFSCVTMALITTRVLQTRRERIIASFLLMLAVPCAPLLGVMLVILARMPLSATLVVFGLILLQVLLAGHLTSRILPGRSGDFIMEIPPMRLPRTRHVLVMTVRQTWLFMKEAVPYFMLATFVLFVADRLGMLALLQDLSRPLVEGVLGLPEATVQVFIKTFIRRENGAAELDRIRGDFTNLQLVVTLIVMTFLAPCVNAVLVLFKERGWRVATVLVATVTLYALALGALVNHLCRAFGFTFGS